MDSKPEPRQLLPPPPMSVEGHVHEAALCNHSVSVVLADEVLSLFAFGIETGTLEGVLALMAKEADHINAALELLEQRRAA